MATNGSGKSDKENDNNMDVDYVISFRFASTDKKEAAAKFEKLVHALATVGLATEVRLGDKQSLLVFVKVSSQHHLYGQVYRSRVEDWIQGVRSAAPEKETRQALEKDPLNAAERLRIIYQLITNHPEDGGAGITPKHGEWKNVESIFALHDKEYNKRWIKHWSSEWYLKPEDLDDIRNRFGEKIAFYFAFTQSYFAFLIFPAVFGASAWLLLAHYSPIDAIFNAVWCIVFTEYWKHQEKDLAIRWGVRNVSRIEHKRKEFRPKEEITDPVTGEKVAFFPATERVYRQLLQAPFAIAVALVLGSLISTCFGIEIFITEIYNGPLKWILVFLPTGILTTLMPILVNLMHSFASQLNDFENYETQSSYDYALSQKIFVINFITSYLPVFLTAFVYVPFATIIVPYLDIFSLTVRPFAEHEGQLKTPDAGHFAINPDRLRKQVIYFTVTAQVVNAAMELVVPYLKRKAFAKVKEIQSERALKKGGAAPSPSEYDAPEESDFLQRVRAEAELDVYDVTVDLREMVLQFGYLSLFSVVWPLTGLSFLVNNWFELRADAMKICSEMQRPTPFRAESIGPWLDSLVLLTWMGSVTESAVCYMFSSDGVGPDGSPKGIRAWLLLLTIFLGEHAFLAVRWAVRVAVSKLESPSAVKERRERYVVRRKYFEESLSELDKLPSLNEKGEESIIRESLEEDQRNLSLKDAKVEDKFWLRQRSWTETAKVGTGMIERSAPDDEEKKSQ